MIGGSRRVGQLLELRHGPVALAGQAQRLWLDELRHAFFAQALQERGIFGGVGGLGDCGLEADARIKQRGTGKGFLDRTTATARHTREVCRLVENRRQLL